MSKLVDVPFDHVRLKLRPLMSEHTREEPPPTKKGKSIARNQPTKRELKSTNIHFNFSLLRTHYIHVRTLFFTAANYIYLHADVVLKGLLPDNVRHTKFLVSLSSRGCHPKTAIILEEEQTRGNQKRGSLQHIGKVYYIKIKIHIIQL